MSTAAALLDRLGRPGGVRLGTRTAETPRLPTGLEALDRALGGGLPRGRVTELTGPRSAGRSGLACAVAARATAGGEVIAWVDAEDALEPDAAAAAGVALERTLWVRPRTGDDALRAAELLAGAGGFGVVVLDLAAGPAARSAVWPRLAGAAERTGTTLLVVAPRRLAGTGAAVALELGPRRTRWSGGAGRLLLLDGIEARVVVARSRVGRPGHALVVRQACA